MTPLGQVQVADYLRQLDDELAGVPDSERQELREDVERHLAAELGEDDSPARVRQVLDRLGTPQVVAAETRRPAGLPAERPPATSEVGLAAGNDRPLPYDGGRGRAVDIATIVLLTGLPIPVLGWLVGLVLLLSTPRWRRSDRLWGALVLPFGYLPFVLAGILPVSRPLQPGLGIALAVLLFVGPTVTVIRLSRHVARSPHRA